MIPYLPLQTINAAFEPALSEAMMRTIRSGWYLHGHETTAFESEFARYIGVAHCVGVGNGLDALTLILTALRDLRNWNEGDEVIVPAMTFIATAEAVVRAGLRVVLCDVNEEGLMDPAQAERAITSRTRALLPVHLYGRTADMAQIGGIGRRHGLAIVEDAAQAHGACLGNGHRAGSASNAAAFSFYPGKNLGALGDGGAVVTGDDALAQRVRMLANYGASEKYNHQAHGCNSRLDELQAAALRVKLPHLDDDNRRRRELAGIYLKGIDNPHIQLPMAGEMHGKADCVYHIFPILCDERDRLQSYLSSHGVQSLIHYPRAIHQQASFASLHTGRYPHAERFAAHELSLPLHPHLTDEEAHRIVRLLCAFT